MNQIDEEFNLIFFEYISFLFDEMAKKFAHFYTPEAAVNRFNWLLRESGNCYEEADKTLQLQWSEYQSKK